MLYNSLCMRTFEDCLHRYTCLAVHLVRNVHFTYCAHKMYTLPHGHVDFNSPTRMLYANAGCLEFFVPGSYTSMEAVEHAYMHCQV